MRFRYGLKYGFSIRESGLSIRDSASGLRASGVGIREAGMRYKGSRLGQRLRLWLRVGLYQGREYDQG